MYDFNEDFAQTYKSECKNCGYFNYVSTQTDNMPEYYTDVYIKCGNVDCDASVHFEIPVN